MELGIIGREERGKEQRTRREGAKEGRRNGREVGRRGDGRGRGKLITQDVCIHIHCHLSTSTTLNKIF